MSCFTSPQGWKDEWWLGVQSCLVPDCRAFGGETCGYGLSTASRGVETFCGGGLRHVELLQLKNK